MLYLISYMLYYVTCYVICCFILYYIILFTLHYIILYYIILYYIILYYIILYPFSVSIHFGAAVSNPECITQRFLSIDCSQSQVCA